ncbi:hypothetical protein [Pseudomonas sp. 22 E 5]|nr:hypothetical protein [Pseudomonas sp. 22 E 5]
MEPVVNYVTYVTSQESDWLALAAAISSAVAAGVSAAVATWALRFSSKQLTAHETYNKLSVKPYLDGENHIDIHKKKLKYVVSNNGVGPAIIKEFSLYVDGSLIESNDPVRTAVELLVPGIDEKDFGHQTIAIGSYIPTEKRIPLFTISTSEYADPNDLLKKLHSSHHLIIRYESVYGEEFVFDSNN